MKKSTIILVAILMSLISETQISAQNTTQVDLNLFQNSSVVVGDDLRDYKGSPYIDENLVEGVITLGNGNQQVYFMRYNVLDERIEFSQKNDPKTLKALPKIKDLVITLSGKTYQYLNIDSLPAGYFEIIKAFDKDTFLLVNHSKRIQESQSKNSYNSSQRSRLVSNQKIFFLSKEKVVKIDNHKKRSLNAFPESKQSDLKDYIKENKIKFSDDYKGLVAVISKYLTM